MILRLLKVCASTRAIKKGRMIHDLIVSSKLEADVVLSNAVLDMYAKNGSIREAMHERDLRLAVNPAQQ